MARRWCFFSTGSSALETLTGNTSTTGGAELQVAYLAAAMAERGDEVRLIYGDGRCSEPPRMVAGVECLDASPSWRRPASFPVFWKAVVDFRPDVTYARIPSDFLRFLSFATRRKPGARFLYAIASDAHCEPWTAVNYNRFVHCPLYGLGLRCADVIAIQHEGQRELLYPRLRGRAVQLPNLVRSFRQSPRPFDRTTFDVVWIAKIRAVKQIDVLLDAALALPDVSFAVAGGFDTTVVPDERRRLERRIAEIRNVSYVGVKNSLTEILALIEQSKVLGNTSKLEGFPNTMLEAWSTGVPVVSLCVDPGGVIATHGMGFVSGSFENFLRDLQTLTRAEEINLRCGSNGLRYVRANHGLASFLDGLERALGEREARTAAVRDGSP